MTSPTLPYNLPVSGQQDAGRFNQWFDTPLLKHLEEHFAAVDSLQRSILFYQWHGFEHGWSGLMGAQAQEMKQWVERICDGLAAQGLELERGGGVAAPAGTEVVEEFSSTDGLDLAARMMTHFEALAWDMEQIIAAAEVRQSNLLSDAMLGLDIFYRRAAGMYRQYLCAMVA